jgi:uncharacterized BrkB/YihY/UPF0761 family membrane protein
MNTNNPFEIETTKPSSTLNVLTILSIIGSVISLIFSVVGYLFAETALEQKQKMIASGQVNELPSFVKSQYNQEAMRLAENMVDNKLPILIIGLVSVILCFYGVMEMRKLKKQGYIIWLIGELLPLISTYLFIGIATFYGLGLLGIIVPVVFIILFTIYQKELIN